MLSGTRVHFLQINPSECMHTIVTWICVVLLRLWPSGEPDNSCTRDVVMDACLWVVCVCVCALKPFAGICHAGAVKRLNPLPPATAGLRAADSRSPLPSSSILPSISWENVTAARTEVSVSFDPLMNENDGSKDGVLLPVSHPMKAKSPSPCSILTGDVSTTLYQWTRQSLSHYLSNYIFLNCSLLIS